MCMSSPITTHVYSDGGFRCNEMDRTSGVVHLDKEKRRQIRDGENILESN